MKKIIILILLNSYLIGSLFGQQLRVEATAGEELSTSSGKLNFTVGECVVAPFQGAKGKIYSGFHQNRCARNLAIAGCNMACSGIPDQVHTFDVTYQGLSGEFTWTASSPDVEFLGGINGETIQVKFTNVQDNNVTLYAAANNSCDGIAAEFNVYIDDKCVWPGWVNRAYDYEVNWDDALAVFVAADSFLRAHDPVTDSPERSLPCYDGAPTELYGFAPHPSTSWASILDFDFVSPDGIRSTYNMKQADCDGDGSINSLISNDSIINTDMDVVAARYFDSIPNFPAKAALKNPPSESLVLSAVDSVVRDGNQLRMRINMGKPMLPSPDVYAVAFAVDFSYGSYKNPQMMVSSSHMLSQPAVLEHGSHDLADGKERAQLFFIIGRRQFLSFPNTGVTFDGDLLCDIVCVTTIADKTSLPDSITISIRDAGYVKVDGSITPLNVAPITLPVAPRQIIVAPKLALAGCFNPGDNLMKDMLRTSGYLPLNEPYSALLSQVPGGAGGEQIDNSVLATPGSNAIVDWVWVELRDSIDNTNIIAARAGLLQRDGDIVDLDGNSPLAFEYIDPGYYFMAIRHRNHLANMTSLPIFLEEATAREVDFTDSSLSLYEENATIVTNGYRAFLGGDTDFSGSVDASDRNNAWNDRNQSGYLPSDCNMDGVVDSEDRSMTWNNRNKSQGLP